MKRKPWLPILTVSALTLGACGQSAVADEGSRSMPLNAVSASLEQDQQRQPPRLDVPYVPTPEPVVEEMLKLANLKKGEKMYDLDCGDGRIVIAAVKKYGAKGVGVDLNPERIRESNENARKEGLADQVKFVEGDLFKMDFKDADVVAMYLLPSVNLKLRPVILNDLKPGTRIVSHAFDMDDWQPDVRREVGGRLVFYWVVPARVGGSWDVDLAGEKYTMSVDQKFQSANATLRTGDRELPATNFSIKGKEVSFDVGSKRYTGIVEGESITGTGWSAIKSRT